MDSLTQFLVFLLFLSSQEAPWQRLLAALKSAYEGDLWHCHGVCVTESGLLKEPDPESRGSGVVFFPSQF